MGVARYRREKTQVEDENLPQRSKKSPTLEDQVTVESRAGCESWSSLVRLANVVGPNDAWFWSWLRKVE